ncbi:MAG: hypothetical protein J6W64_00085 [Bacilli bacterium]|nr:hypothetical protein [Bacilli bacterium]
MSSKKKNLLEAVVVTDGDAMTYMDGVYCPQCESMDVEKVGKDKITDELHYIEHYRCDACGCNFIRKISCELEVTDPGFTVDEPGHRVYNKKYNTVESLEDTVDQDLNDNRQPKKDNTKVEYKEPVNAMKIRKHEKAIKDESLTERIDTINKNINVKDALKRVYNNDFEETQRLAELIGIDSAADLEDFISKEGLIDEEPIDTLKRYINATFEDTIAVKECKASDLKETINLDLSTSANPEDYFDTSVRPGHRLISPTTKNVTAYIDVSGSQCTKDQVDAALKIAKQYYNANNILYFAQRLGSINPYDYKNSKNNLFDLYGGGSDYTEVIKYIQSHADEMAVVITDDDIFYCPGISKNSAAADLVGHPDTIVCVRDEYKNPLRFNELNEYDSRIK